MVLITAISTTTITNVFAFTGYRSFNLNDQNDICELFSESNTFDYRYNEETKTYTYDLSNRRENVEIMSSPQITVLTHGLGSNAGTWSNKISSTNKDASFAYDKDSIIEKISEKASEAKIYWAEMSDDKKILS